MSPSTHDPTVVEATMIARVVKFLRHLGHDPVPILAEANIRLEDLDDMDRMWPLRQAMAVYDATGKALDDRAFGLAVAQWAEPTDYGLVGLIWAHQDTLDEALDALSRFYNAFLEGASLTIVRSEEATRVISRFDHDHPGLDALRYEVLASIYLQARRASRRSWHPLAVHYALPAAAPERFRDVFGVDVVFDAESDCLIIHPDILSTPKADADPILRAHLLEAAETHLAKRRRASGAQARLLRLDGCTVDLRTGTVTRGSQSLTLTTKERAIMDYLASRPNQVVSHEDLERDVWGIGRTVITHAPAVAIRRLRQKIEPPGKKPVNIVTVFGEGWRLVVPEGASQA